MSAPRTPTPSPRERMLLEAIQLGDGITRALRHALEEQRQGIRALPSDAAIQSYLVRARLKIEELRTLLRGVGGA